MLKKNAKVDLLRNVRLFSSCNDKELGRIAALTDVVDVPAGKVLTEEGKAGGEAFVIAAGQATAKVNKKKVATMGPGSFFGEMSLLDHGPRTATIVSDEPMTLLVLDPRSFVELLEDVPSVSRKIMRTLAERLREVDKTIR